MTVVSKSFDSFVKKIPVNIHNNTKSIFTGSMAVFIPGEFVIGRPMRAGEYQFVICFTTPPRAVIGSREYSFKKGSLICMAPGDEITVCPPDRPSPVKYLTICVNPAYMRDIYTRAGGEGELIFGKPDSIYSHRLLEGIEALIREVSDYDPAIPLMIESMENRIAIQLLRDSGALGNNKPLRNTVGEAIGFIETYYSSNITVKNISDAVYVSPPHLQRIFLSQTGITPYRYVMDCRHRKAKEMLESTAAPVKEIAERCGFVNAAHFSTSFKQREGVSPLVYKKTFIKK
jgi:AraC-like DNA-binding protein